MNIALRHIFFSALATVAVAGGAITPEDVNKAVSLARESPKNRVLNRKAGVALQEAGRYKEAITYYLKSDNSGNLGAAECYFYLYDYDTAEEYLDKYLEKRSKAEEAKDNDFSYGDGTETIDWTENLRNRINLGRSMLDRVEKIEIIDSINVPSDDFFKFIKLAKSAGRLDIESEIDNAVSEEALQQLGITSLWAPVYSSESGDDMIWYGSTENGDSKMFESIRLTDGSWDKPAELFDYQSIFGNGNGSWVSYPFLMSDGVTLYFAADGENSLGELDIFISRRDSDGFLQPSNVGMPYNSPYNDYMYAIDEENGTGWWVTDRNQLKDSVTIYTFIPQELRVNYPVDTPDLTDFARVKSIAMTQNQSADYDDLKARIASLSTENAGKSGHSFEFALPGQRIITSTSQLSNPQARTALNEYLSKEESYEKLCVELATLRAAYTGNDKNVSEKILSYERERETLRLELRRLKNKVVRLELQ